MHQTKVEEFVEQIKDEVVILTCEVGEHSSPEEVIAVDDQAQETDKKARTAITEFKKYLAECQASFRMLEPSKTADLLDHVKRFSQFVETQEQELNTVQKTIKPVVMKAKRAIELKRAEEEKERKKQEQIRLQELAKVKSARAAEIGMFSDYAIKVGECFMMLER